MLSVCLGPFYVLTPTCEHLENPLGLDERSPRLCWILKGDGRGRRRSAFEIRVAENPASLAGTDRLSWCSGRVASAETRDIAYAGAPLQPRTRYHWTVLVWDEAGRELAPAAPARFETGLLDEPWGSDWLTGPAALRRFRTDESDKAYVNPHRARAVA